MRLLFLIISGVCLIALASHIGVSKGENMRAEKKYHAAKNSATISPPVLSKQLQKKQYALDSIFTTDYKHGIFNGCAAVLYHGTTIYQSALGFENIKSKNHPNGHHLWNKSRQIQFGFQLF